MALVTLTGVLGSGAQPISVNKSKSADQTVSGSTTLVDVADLAVDIVENQQLVLTWTLAAVYATLGQLKLAVTAPAGATLMATASMQSNGIAPATASSSSSGGAMTLTAALSTAGNVTVSATVQNGPTPGKVALQMAQAAAMGTTTIKAMSSVSAREAA